MRTRKSWSLVGALFILLVCTSQTPATAQDDSKELFSALQHRLVADGFDAERIKALFADDDVFFEIKGVSQYFQHNEATLNYKKMTKRSWIGQGRVYMKQQREALQKALTDYGVDPKVITAIILVETKFGRYTGKRSIMSILSTMATLADPGPREYLWRQLPKDKRIDRDLYEQKADQKAEWAYRELKAFLLYTEQHQMDAASIKGSYAGALGIAQFMPSNILAYGRDGNGDGRIDLFDDADAIVSIASYLQHYGWKPGLDRKQAYKVVYHYNHSKYYVDTILEIADLLEG